MAIHHTRSTCQKCNATVCPPAQSLPIREARHGRRLDGDVPQEKLNLIQLAAGQMAQAGAGPSEVVRRQSFDESPRVTVS